MLFFSELGIEIIALFVYVEFPYNQFGESLLINAPKVTSLMLGNSLIHCMLFLKVRKEYNCRD